MPNGRRHVSGGPTETTAQGLWRDRARLGLTNLIPEASA